MKFFLPDYRFPSFSSVTAAFLTKENIRALILDIDNTLEPYENPDPTEAVRAWFLMLREAGVGAAFVSNNNKERVERFNRDLGLPAYPKAGKPSAVPVRRAMAALCADPDTTALMGDQIFTDVWAAHAAGIRAILVPPIRDRRDLLTRAKRALEKPILKFYERKKKHE